MSCVCLAWVRDQCGDDSGAPQKNITSSESVDSQHAETHPKTGINVSMALAKEKRIR